MDEPLVYESREYALASERTLECAPDTSWAFRSAACEDRVERVEYTERDESAECDGEAECDARDERVEYTDCEECAARVECAECWLYLLLAE